MSAKAAHASWTRSTGKIGDIHQFRETWFREKRV